MLDIAGAIRRVREKVKNRAIVPEIHKGHAPVARNIRLDPRDRRVGKARLRSAERLAGDVKDRQALNAAGDQAIHEAGIPASNIDHSTTGPEPCRVEQSQRKHWLWLKPTQFGWSLRQKHLFPMLFAVHRRPLHAKLQWTDREEGAFWRAHVKDLIGPSDRADRCVRQLVRPCR
jgi:hypothetical protein